MKIYLKNAIEFPNLIVKGNFEQSYIKLTDNTIQAIKNNDLRIVINQVGGAKKIKEFICNIGATSGEIRISVGGEEQCIVDIGNNVHGSFYITMYRGSKISIGENTTSNGCRIFCDHSFVNIGKDCMISDEVILQSSDQHAIINIKNKKIVNKLGEYSGITLEEHVWIARRVVVTGDVNIRKGSIIGIGSIVTSDVMKNSIYAGNPARIIKKDVTWLRHPNKFESYVVESIGGK